MVMIQKQNSSRHSGKVHNHRDQKKHGRSEAVSYTHLDVYKRQYWWCHYEQPSESDGRKLLYEKFEEVALSSHYVD